MDIIKDVPEKANTNVFHNISKHFHVRCEYHSRPIIVTSFTKWLRVETKPILINDIFFEDITVM